MPALKIKPPVKKAVITPEVVPHDRVPEENEPYLVQIRDHAGHLLFCYNTRTDSIEYRERGVTYSVSVQVLRQTSYSNIFGDKPVNEITMQADFDPLALNSASLPVDLEIKTGEEKEDVDAFEENTETEKQ